MPLNLGLKDYNSDFNNKIQENIIHGNQAMKNKIDKTYKRIPKPVRYILPRSEKATVRLTNMAQRAQESRFVPSIVTKGLYGTAAATALKNTYKQTRTRGGKTKKTKKQNKYTKKEKKKINGIIKVIYSKKNSRKLYVKSKNKMMNLKRYKKISKKG